MAVSDKVKSIIVEQLGVDEEQIIFEGTSDEMRRCEDLRVSQFVRGEAGERLTTRASLKVMTRT